MNARARKLRAVIRTSRKEARARKLAARALSSGTPVSVRTHLVALGASDATAKRYAAALSRGLTPASTTQTTIKLKGRVTKTVSVKLYDTATFLTRLAAYRPKTNPEAAQLFAQLAAAAA